VVDNGTKVEFVGTFSSDRHIAEASNQTNPTSKWETSGSPLLTPEAALCPYIYTQGTPGLHLNVQ